MQTLEGEVVIGGRVRVEGRQHDDGHRAISVTGEERQRRAEGRERDGVRVGLRGRIRADSDLAVSVVADLAIAIHEVVAKLVRQRLVVRRDRVQIRERTEHPAAVGEPALEPAAAQIEGRQAGEVVLNPDRRQLRRRGVGRAGGRPLDVVVRRARRDHPVVPSPVGAGLELDLHTGLEVDRHPVRFVDRIGRRLSDDGLRPARIDRHVPTPHLGVEVVGRAGDRRHRREPDELHDRTGIVGQDVPLDLRQLHEDPAEAGEIARIVAELHPVAGRETSGRNRWSGAAPSACSAAAAGRRSRRRPPNRCRGST